MAFHFASSGKLRAPSEAELAAAEAAGGAVVVLSSGTLADGSPYWAYLAVKPTRYKDYLDITSTRQPLVLEEYGRILACGLDSEVPPEVQADMKQRYGCHDQYVATLARQVQEAQTVFLQQKEEQRLGDIVAMLKNQRQE